MRPFGPGGHESRSKGHGLGGGGFGRGHGGRMFGSGDLRLVFLALIEQQPRHGYELIKAVEDLFGGAYAPSAGSVYPTLTLLEETGQIQTAPSEGNKKLYEITDAGREQVAANKVLLDAILSRVGIASRSLNGQRPPDGVFQAMQTLKTALVLHARNWDEAEVSRVTQIIADAATKIERGK